MPEQYPIDPLAFDPDRIDTSHLSRRCLWGIDIEDIPVPEPLIEGIFDLNTTCLLWGPSGHYKSFLAQSWALSVATGLDWFNRQVKQGYVLYIVGEGFMGMGQRQRAWMKHIGMNSDPPIAYLDGSPNLLREEGRKELLEFVNMICPSFTIIDTVARAIPGGVENDFQTMSALVECMDAVKRVTDGVVLGVHHAGKDADNGARGHSSLYGAMDTVLRLRDDVLFVEKQKHHEDNYTLMKFKTVHYPPSLVLVPEKVEKLSPNEKTIVEALRALGGEASHTALKDAALARRVPDGSFNRTLRALVKRVILVRDPSDPSAPYTLGDGVIPT